MKNSVYKHYAYIKADKTYEETCLSRDYVNFNNLEKYILNNFSGKVIVYYFTKTVYDAASLPKYDSSLLQDVFLYEIEDYEILSAVDLKPSTGVLMWLNEDRIMK